MIKPHDRVTLASEIGYPLILTVVSDFYDRIQQHSTLAKPFETVSDWEEHKVKIAHFWFMGLGGRCEPSYRFDPISKHFAAGFNEALLADWKSLFHEVLLHHIEAPLAQQWFERVEMIGSNLLKQNERLIQSRINP